MSTDHVERGWVVEFLHSFGRGCLYVVDVYFCLFMLVAQVAGPPIELTRPTGCWTAANYEINIDKLPCWMSCINSWTCRRRLQQGLRMFTPFGDPVMFSIRMYCIRHGFVWEWRQNLPRCAVFICFFRISPGFWGVYVSKPTGFLVGGLTWTLFWCSNLLFGWKVYKLSCRDRICLHHVGPIHVFFSSV